MNIEFKETPTVIAPEYPCYKKFVGDPYSASFGMIVLFFKPTHGVVVKSANTFKPVGLFDTNWSDKFGCWEKLTGGETTFKI